MDCKAAHRSMLCSEIVSLHFRGRTGRDREPKSQSRRGVASGAILWTDVPIRQRTSLWFLGGDFEFRGQVAAQRLLSGIGYLVEMRFSRAAGGLNENIAPNTFSILWCCLRTGFRNHALLHQDPF